MRKKRIWLWLAMVSVGVLVPEHVWHATPGQRPLRIIAASPAPSSSHRQPGQAPQLAETKALTTELNRIVDTFRQSILLMEAESDKDADREALQAVGQILFADNHARQESLRRLLIQDNSWPQEGASEDFLDFLESRGALHDADKLAFEDTLIELILHLHSIEKRAERQDVLLQRLIEDKLALVEIQNQYEKEMAPFWPRTAPQVAMRLERQKWQDYIAFIRTKFQVPAILAEHREALEALRRHGKSSKGQESGRREISGEELPPKTVALTFDDGPHPHLTPKVLAILHDYGLPPAIFFEVGENIGTIKDNQVILRAAAAASRSVLIAGHSIGNHTFTHPLLTRLTEAQIGQELDRTSLVMQKLGISPALFRAPYGGRNPLILDMVARRNMRSMMWDIDSKDWADPIPRSIAQRVIRLVHQEGHGIILFHDIHARSVAALPLVIETLKAEGYKFASWNGHSFTVPAPRKAMPGTFLATGR